MEIIKTLGYIVNENGKFDICVVDDCTDLWLATYDPDIDELDTLCPVDSIDNAYEVSNMLFSTGQTEYVLTSTKIKASDSKANDEILFTPAALLDFLLQIDELADYGVSVEEANSSIIVKIGNSEYTISMSDAQEIEAPDEVVEEVAEVNTYTYDEIANSDYTQEPDGDIV